MSEARRKLAGITLVAVTAAFVVGCTQPEPRSSIPPPGVGQLDAGPPPVVVGRGDLVSRVSLRGTVIASPAALVLAPRRDVVRFTARSIPERPIKTGQVLARVGGVAIAAPFNGFFERRLVPDGTPVAANAPIAALRYGGFGVVVRIPIDLAYRFYRLPRQGRTQVIGGPGPSDCALFRVPLTANPESSENSAQSPGSAGGSAGQLACFLPPDAPVVEGLAAVVVLETARKRNVLLLPALAVAGAVDRGLVTKIESDGSRREVEVKLGISDGTYVEIVDGLVEGDRVSTIAPSLELPAR